MIISMIRTNLFFLTVLLVCLFVIPLAGDEQRPTLRQLIAASRKDPTNRVIGFSRNFSVDDVRKNFFGNEVAFCKEVATLLQTNEDDDVWDAYSLIRGLDIRDETISRLLRGKFASSNPWLQINLCSALAGHPSKENIDFLIDVLKQSDYPQNVRYHAAYCLSYFTTEIGYFGSLDTDLKNNILQAFLSCLDSGKEIHCQFRVEQDKLGDCIAHLLGHFESIAAPTLPKIKEKFTSAQGVKDKLNLAWAIVRIAPESLESSDALNFLLREAVENKSNYTRGDAIALLETLPEILSDRIVLCLLTVLQKEIDISNKVRAAEVLVVMLKHKEHMTIDNGDFDEEREDGEDTE